MIHDPQPMIRNPEPMILIEARVFAQWTALENDLRDSHASREHELRQAHMAQLCLAHEASEVIQLPTSNFQVPTHMALAHED